MMGPFFFVQVTSHMFQFKIPEEIHRIDSEARMVHINCVIPSLDYCFFFQDKTTHLWSIGNFLSIRRFHQFLFLFLKEILLPCIYLTNPQINFVLSIVAALYEMRMQLSDDGGVLKDWKDDQTTLYDWANICCQDNKVIAM